MTRRFAAAAVDQSLSGEITFSLDERDDGELAVSLVLDEGEIMKFALLLFVAALAPLFALADGYVSRAAGAVTCVPGRFVVRMAGPTRWLYEIPVNLAEPVGTLTCRPYTSPVTLP